MKKDFLYMDLTHLWESNDIKEDEYLLIIKGVNVNKAVWLYYPKMPFQKHLRYYEHLNFN